MKIHSGIEQSSKTLWAIKSILFVFILLFSLNISVAYIKSDYLQMTYNTEFCSDNCIQDYRLYVKDLKVFDMDIAVSDFKTNYILTDVSKETLSTSLVVNTKPILYDFYMYYNKQNILLNGSVVYNYVLTNPKEIKDILASKKDGDYIDIRFKGKVMKDKSIDIIMTYADFIYSEYGIWNGSYSIDLNVSSSSMVFYQYYDNETNGKNVSVFTQISAGERFNIFSSRYNGTSGNSANKTRVSGYESVLIENSKLFGLRTSGNISYEFDYYGRMGSGNTEFGFYTGGNSTLNQGGFLSLSVIQRCAGHWGYWNGVSAQCFNPSKDYVDNTWEHIKITCDTLTKNCSIQFNNNGSWAYFPPRSDILNSANGIFFGGLSANGLSYLVDNVIAYSGNSIPLWVAPTHPPTITYISQSPSDITSTNVVNNPLNITYNITDATDLNTSKIFLYYKSNSTTRNTICFINGTKCLEWQNTTQTSNISNAFLFKLYDNEIYPATYNVNDETTDDFAHTTQTLANANQYVAIELLNITNTTSYNFFEIMSNSTILQRLYFCNQSYTFTNSPDTNSNCALIYTLTANSNYSHQHSQYSSHQVLPFAINTSKGTINNILITEKSYFLLRGGVGTIYYYSVTNTTRTNTTKTTNNGGNTWSAETFTVDAHLHQYSGNSTLYYYVCANDTANSGSCSIVRNDTYELDNFAPTQVNFISPVNRTYINNITIQYTQSVSLSNATIESYNISLLNSDYTFNKTIKGNNSLNLTYEWNIIGTQNGFYIIRVEARETAGRISTSYSEIFEISSYYTNLNYVYPINNSNVENLNLTFYYNLQANNPISNCSLYIDGKLNQTNTTIRANKTNQILYSNNSIITCLNNNCKTIPAFAYLNSNKYINSADFFYSKVSDSSALNVNVTFYYNNYVNSYIDLYHYGFGIVYHINSVFPYLDYLADKVEIFQYTSGAGGSADFSNLTIYGYELNSFFVNELSLGSHNYSISCYNITNSEITKGISYFNTVNLTPELPTFKLDSFNYNCSFNNCSLYFIYNSSCNMTMTVNSINYNSNITNTNHNFLITPLSENTIYLLSYNAYGNYSYNVTGTFNIQTKSYSELLYSDSIITKDYLILILIAIILFVLYIVSEIFKIEMLGVLSGIGFIIFSFALRGIEFWFFIIVLFTGIVIFARSVLAWLW